MLVKRYPFILTLILVMVAVAANGQETATDNLRIAMKLSKKGKPETSILFCTRALEIDNTMSSAYFLRGYNHYQLQNYDEAIRDFSAALHFDPQYLDAYFYRAKCRQATNNFLGAIQDFNRARELNPAQATFFVVKGIFSHIFGGRKEKTNTLQE